MYMMIFYFCVRNWGLAVRHGVVFLEVFTSLFSKSDRRPTLRALDRRRLLKKAGENFCTDIAVKSPTNQNLKTKRLIAKECI